MAVDVEPGRSARTTAVVLIVEAEWVFAVPPLWMQRRRSARVSGAQTNAERAGDTPWEAAKGRDEPMVVPVVAAVVVVAVVVALEAKRARELPP